MIMVAHNGGRLERVAGGIENVVPFLCDISSEDELGRLLRFLQDNHRELDTTLLNAGVTHIYRLFGDQDARTFAELEMRTNYRSAVTLLTGLIPILERNAEPVAVITTSGAALGAGHHRPDVQRYQSRPSLTRSVGAAAAGT